MFCFSSIKFGFLAQDLVAVKALIKNSGWEKESDFRTEWTYDKKGNQTSMITDRKPPAVLNNPVIKNSDFIREFGYAEDETFGYVKGEILINFHPSKIIIEKSTFDYQETKDGVLRLAQVTDWLPRFNEPLKTVKKYTYFDTNNIEIEWA